MKRTIKPTTNPLQKRTIMPLPDQKEIDAVFATKFSKRASDSGANDYVGKFMEIAKTVTDTSGSWAFSDFSYRNQPLQIPGDQLRFLFDAYCNELIRKGVITRTDGCFDYEVYSRN